MPTFCGASRPIRRLADGQKFLALRTGTESPNMSEDPAVSNSSISSVVSTAGAAFSLVRFAI